MKSLLAVPPLWGGCEQAIAFACSAAGRMGAALDIVFIDDRGDYPVLAAVGEAMYGLSHDEREEAERREAIAGAKSLHERFAAEAGLGGIFDEEMRPARDILSTMAYLQDAVLLARPSEDVGRPYQEAVRSAIFESSRPILVAPGSLTDFGLGHAFVMWNGTPQAARAIRAFSPLAGKFERVTLAGFGEQDFGPVESFLRRHGATTTVKPLEGEGLSARQRGRIVIGEACGGEADMLVMGAFGDGRLDRLLGLGGSTEKVVTSCPVALLLAH